MRRTLITGLVIAALAASFVGYRHYGPKPSEELASKRATAALHRSAPDFTLKQLSGQTLRLSDCRGKVVLLDFWATWCEPCRKETPFFVELQNKYADQGLQIIGVSMDDTADPVPAFYREFKMNYPVVMGNAQVGELYGGVLGLPIAFLIGRDGVIHAKHIGATDASVFEREIVELMKEGK